MQDWFSNLQERERRMVLIGAAAVSVMILWLVVGPLYGNLSKLETQVERQATDLDAMREIAARTGIVHGTLDESGGSIVLKMQTSAARQNLQIDNYQPTGNTSVNASLNDASFNAVIRWLAALDNQYGISVQNASIRRGNEPGTVDSQLVLVQN